MDQLKAHGAHVFLDYTGYAPQQEDDGAWMLELMVQAVEECQI